MFDVICFNLAYLQLKFLMHLSIDHLIYFNIDKLKEKYSYGQFNAVKFPKLFHNVWERFNEWPFSK